MKFLRDPGCEVGWMTKGFESHVRADFVPGYSRVRHNSVLEFGFTVCKITTRI